jgi:MYXO-CTERM domain-containing protein
MKIKTTLIAAALLLSITSAQAALVESDWKNTGDALVTLDTDTGIEWLKLNNTTNMSYNDVLASTSNGSTLDGWRLPNPDEIDTLMTNMVFPTSVARGTQRSLSQWNPINVWNGHMELTLLPIPNISNDRNSLGLSKNETGELVQTGTVINHLRLLRNQIEAPAWADDFAPSGYGWFLVSDGGVTLSSQLDPTINANNASAPTANVSAPALLGLIGLGLFGFAARRRSSTTTLNK